MPDRLILALDAGTSSSRAIVYDAQGQVRAQARRTLPVAHPRPGWVEQSPEDIWTTALEAAREAVTGAGGPAAIAALGIANQRETALVWHRSSLDPIGPAIVWQCRRTAPAIAAWPDERRREIQARTGLIPDAYFSGPKLAWLLDHVPGARQRAEAGELAAGTVDSWLLARLSNAATHATDRTNASRTMLWNLQTADWDPQLAQWQNVPPQILPTVRPATGRFALAAPEHLGADIPVTAVAGDQQASFAALGSRRDAAAVATYGTGAFILAAAPDRATSANLLRTAGTDDGILLEGGVFTAGAAVDWACNALRIAPGAAELCSLAAQTPTSAGVAFSPALAGLGAPHWNPDARASLSGLSLATRPEHIARAVLEGIADRIAEIVHAMRAGGAQISSLRAAGGLARSDAFLQIQADALGISVQRPAQVEATAYGAALLAAAAAGLPPLPPIRTADRFEPSPAAPAATVAP